MKLHFSIFFAACAVLLLSSCLSRSNPTSLYVLDLPEESVKRGALNVNLAMLDVPAYLDQNDIVRLYKRHQLRSIPQCQWAQGFSRQLRVVLRGALEQRSNKEADVSYRAMVTVHNFELNERNSLDVYVSAVLKCPGRADIVRTSKFSLAWDGKDMDGLMVLYEQAVCRVADEIVK